MNSKTTSTIVDVRFVIIWCHVLTIQNTLTILQIHLTIEIPGSQDGLMGPLQPTVGRIWPLLNHDKNLLWCSCVHKQRRRKGYPSKDPFVSFLSIKDISRFIFWSHCVLLELFSLPAFVSSSSNVFLLSTGGRNAHSIGVLWSCVETMAIVCPVKENEENGNTNVVFLILVLVVFVGPTVVCGSA